MKHHHVRIPHRLQSRTDAERKTVRLGKPRGTGRHCRCKQHRKSAMPTPNTRESFRCTTFRTCFLDASTEFFESCHSQTRSRPDDVSFLARTWTRRTTKQFFQQLTFCLSSRSDWNIAKNNLKTGKATHCRTMSRNVCGPFSACLGSCVPEGVAVTTTNFFFSGEDRDKSRRQPKGHSFFLFCTETPTPPVPLERLLHQIGSCRAAADDTKMFFVPTKIAHHFG